VNLPVIVGPTEMLIMKVYYHHHVNGVRLRLGTAATNGHIVHPADDI
jgi:hypothetical protein